VPSLLDSAQSTNRSAVKVIGVSCSCLVRGCACLLEPISIHFLNLEAYLSGVSYVLVFGGGAYTFQDAFRWFLGRAFVDMVERRLI